MLLVLGACSQTIYMKENHTREVMMPTAAGWMDEFVYKTPSGQVDVAFVVDNTRSFEAGLDNRFFETGYRRFLNRIENKTSDARLLDYRVQLASTPGHSMPGNYVGVKVGSVLQTGELFSAAGALLKPWRRGESYPREAGFPNPIVSAGVLLKNEAFAGRKASSVFLVFFLGDDLDPATKDQWAEQTAAFKKQCEELHSFAKTHVLVGSRLDESAAPYPLGFKFRRATEFLNVTQTLPFRSRMKADLNDRDWSSWDTTLFDSILENTSKSVLSFVPKDPAMMVVRGSRRLFRYGEDFTWNSIGNEIEWLAPGQAELKAGDHFWVQYTVQEGTVSGGKP